MKQWEKLRLFFSIVWRTSHAYVLSETENNT